MAQHKNQLELEISSHASAGSETDSDSYESQLTPPSSPGIAPTEVAEQWFEGRRFVSMENFAYILPLDGGEYDRIMIAHYMMKAAFKRFVFLLPFLSMRRSK